VSSILRVHKLVKRYGGLVATDRADLVVRKGELHALIGPNGAGKTSLLGQLAGTISPDGGSILFEGEDITRMPIHRRVQRGLARSYQITSIFKSEFTVLENICLAVQARHGSPYRFWRPVSRDVAIEAQARSVLHSIGLSGVEHSPAASLSHGQQRQVEIGLAIATNAKLLLLDEPMAGVSADESKAMTRLLASLKGRSTIVLVEHDMDAVFALADTVSVLVYGRVIASGTAEQIRNNPAVKRAYLGDEVSA
jgi:branched-chain amino acid transport system ATP-binding protein